MKAILTLGIVSGLLMTIANLEVTAQREMEVFDAEQARGRKLGKLVTEALEE